MAATAPLAIGARGTVGSLVRKELEDFTGSQINNHRKSGKPQRHLVDLNSCGGNNRSRRSFWFPIRSWRRGRRRNGGGGGGFLPNICSTVEVSDCNSLNRISGFSYRIVDHDAKSVIV